MKGAGNSDSSSRASSHHLNGRVWTSQREYFSRVILNTAGNHLICRAMVQRETFPYERSQHSIIKPYATIWVSTQRNSSICKRAELQDWTFNPYAAPLANKTPFWMSRSSFITSPDDFHLYYLLSIYSFTCWPDRWRDFARSLPADATKKASNWRKSINWLGD